MYRTTDVLAVLEDRIARQDEVIENALIEYDKRVRKTLEILEQMTEQDVPGQLQRALHQGDVAAVKKLLRWSDKFPWSVNEKEAAKERDFIVDKSKAIKSELAKTIELLKGTGEDTISHSRLKDLGLLTYVRSARW